MRSYTLTHTDTKSVFTIKLSPELRLNPNKKYEAALLSVNVFNSIPNITEENNKFKYSTDNGQTWKIITLEKGNYEIAAINDEIQRIMIVNGDYDVINQEFYITISADIQQLKSIVNITNPSYRIDFGIENSLGQTLGFNPLVIQHGYNKSENIVDITKVNLVLINVDIITGSYVNGYQSPCIYSFDPYKVPPGYKIDDRPNPSLTYYPVTRTDINEVRIWLTDQSNKLIDIRGEKVTIKIQIREVVNIKQQIKRALRELKKENIL